jgi:hypothetical protein
MQAEGADEISTKGMKSYRSRRSNSSEADQSDLEQGDRDQNRADQGDLEEGNPEQAVVMIQVKGAVGTVRDVPRVPVVAYRRAVAAAELSGLMGERRPSAQTCFNIFNFFRFMKKWPFWTFRQ